MATSLLQIAYPVAWFSLWQSSATVIVSLLIGGGLAILTYSLQITPPRWLWLLLAIPVFLPHPIVGAALIGSLGKLSLTKWILYKPAAVVLAHLYYNIPLAYLLTSLALQSIPQSLSSSISVFGASRWQQFKLVVWPKIRTSLLQTGSIIFLYCFTSFSLPLMIGGYKAKTIEVLMYEQFALYHNTQLVLTLAFLQFVLLLVILLPLIFTKRRLLETQLPSASQAPTPWWLHAVHVLLGALVVTPLLITYLQVPATLLTTSFWPAIARTLIYGLIATSLALTISYLIKQDNRLAIVWLCVSPITVSTIVGLVFGKSVAIQLLLYCVLVLPITSVLMHQRWLARPFHFEDTLLLLTNSAWQRTKFRLQWLRPAILTSLAAGVVYVLGDLAVASVVSPSNSPTAMQVAMQLLGSYRFSLASSAFFYILLIIVLTYSLTYTYAKHN